MPLSVVILAAGKGTRMCSKHAKVLHLLAGKPLLKHVIDTASELQPDNIFVVVGHDKEQIKTILADEPITWVQQLEQKGTGHAMQQAAEHIPDQDDVLILYGDVPLGKSKTFKSVIKSLDEHALCLLTAVLENPNGYGRIVRDDSDNMVAIVEDKDASEDQRSIQEINTGIMAAKGGILKNLLSELRCDNAQGEYYLTDTIGLASDAKHSLATVSVDNIDETSGVNDRSQLARLERIYQRAIADKLMSQGVTLHDPSRIDIRGELAVGQDSSIDINCVFSGKNTIGKGVAIGPNCVISNTHIHDNAVIEANCVIENSVIGAHCNIGPFARMRPGTVLSEKAKLGNFVETKNSQIGVGSKVNHLSYVGDSDIADKVNIGAGVITANYDGANKHRTKIGDRVFIGSNSVLVAPININEGSTIGAGSTVTKNIGDNELVFTRAKARTVANWQRPKKK